MRHTKASNNVFSLLLEISFNNLSKCERVAVKRCKNERVFLIEFLRSNSLLKRIIFLFSNVILHYCQAHSIDVAEKHNFRTSRDQFLLPLYLVYRVQFSQTRTSNPLKRLCLA